MNLTTKFINGSFGIKRRIKKDTLSKNPNEIYKEYLKHFEIINRRTKKEKGIMIYHRISMVMGLALYRAMINEYSDHDLLQKHIMDILYNATAKYYVNFKAFFINRSIDPFENFLKQLGPKNEKFFPCPPWDKRPIPVENGTGWHQYKCPYYEFLVKEDSLEMARTFCDYDKRTVDAVSKYVEMRRFRTLVDGDESCDFLYYRK